MVNSQEVTAVGQPACSSQFLRGGGTPHLGGRMMRSSRVAQEAERDSGIGGRNGQGSMSRFRWASVDNTRRLWGVGAVPGHVVARAVDSSPGV